MKAKIIDFFVRILTGGKYRWIDEKDIKPIIVLEKIDNFDVDNLIDFDAFDEMYNKDKVKE